MLAAGADHLLVGLGDARVVELPRDGHLEAQIVGADEQRIDALHRGDLLALRDALRRFDHHHHQRLLVDDARGLGDRDRREAELRQRAAHRALADRGVAAGIGAAARLRGVVDVREHDALGAVVQHPRGVPVLHAGDAHHRRDADRERSGRDLRRGVGVERAVLAVDEQPVEAGGLGDGGDADGARLGDAQADGEFPGAQLAQGVVRYGAHWSLPVIPAS